VPKMEVPKMEVPKVEVPKTEVQQDSGKSEGKRLTAEPPKRNKRQKSSKTSVAPKPPRLPFTRAVNPVQVGAWCSKPGMTYAEKLKANMRAANPAVMVRMEKVSVAPPRVPPTDPLEDSIYGCISSLFDISDRSALEDALASAAASPSPSLPHSTISGTPGRCLSPAPSDASTDVGNDWLITPPPCFLRSGSAPAPAITPLENLLIEHPSMSVYVRPFEATAGGFSSMSYSFLSSKIDNRLHDVIDIDSDDVDDDDDENDIDEALGEAGKRRRNLLISEDDSEDDERAGQEEEEEKKKLESSVDDDSKKLDSEARLAVFDRFLCLNAASKQRQTLPKGQGAKAMSRRSHAVAAAVAATQRRADVEAAMGVASGSTTTTPAASSSSSSSHAALIHAPLTPLQLNAQKRRRERDHKKASKRGLAQLNAAFHAASAPRGAVSRRHKMARCFSGANNNRKCNSGVIRC